MKKAVLYFMAVALIMSCNSTKKTGSDPFAPLTLEWSFLGNDPGNRQYSAAFELSNKGDETLGESGWAIYLSQMGHGIVEGSESVALEIVHVNGDLLRISPRAGFSLPPGERVRLEYLTPLSLLKESQAPMGPYLVCTEQDQEKVMPISDYRILPFPELEKIFPSGSGMPLPDAAWVFGQNEGWSGPLPGEDIRIVPQVVESHFKDGSLLLDEGLSIYHESSLFQEAVYLADILKSIFGKAFPLQEGSETGPGVISLQTGGKLKNGGEGYQLLIDETEGIKIIGEGAAGVFYGIQTMLSLIPVEAWKASVSSLDLPLVQINDAPAFPYRGMHLDIARNFIPVQDIKRLIQVMAFYKLNTLHLHLTDDEGWRIEIPSLPELTDVGAYRGHSADEANYLIPAYGSGPLARRDANHGNGYITAEEYKELLSFAADRHVEIIPEINFPGHARAAIKAMEHRFRRLMEEGKEEEAWRYRLIDTEDASVYNSAQNFNDNVVCVSLDGPYNLFSTVLETLMALHAEAGVHLRTIHTGGDEVPHGVWTASPSCAEFLAAHPEIEGYENLQPYFEGRIHEIIRSKGLNMGGWEEIAMMKDETGKWVPNPAFAGKGVLPYIWNSIGRFSDLGNRLANAGYPVILCNVKNFYFDLAYSHHPAEPGLYWGGFVNTKRAFELAPYHMCLNEKGRELLKEESRDNIAGLQAQLWSETVKGGKMAEYYYLPKLLGFAERAWHGEAAWGGLADEKNRSASFERDWAGFARALGGREMPRLDGLFGGYNYRLPPPGALIKDGKLHANIAFPGLEIRYTTDGSQPGPSSPLYTAPVELPEGTTALALRSFDTRGRGSRTSRVGL